MKKVLPVIMLSLGLIACGRIDTGNVGVRTTFTGKVLTTEMEQGFYTSFTSSVLELVAKEITVELNDLTPKAADNLSLKDMDIEVYYTAEKYEIAEQMIKYSGRTVVESGLGYPSYLLVRSMAREAAYDVISRYDSLKIHKNRDEVKNEIHSIVQDRLNEDDEGVFIITKVIIRSIVTDPSVERAIKLAVAKNKELEAKLIEVKIAREQANVNKELNASLTDKILRARELDVMALAVESGSKPLVMFGTSSGVYPIINMQ